MLPTFCNARDSPTMKDDTVQKLEIPAEILGYAMSYISHQEIVQPL